MKNYIIAGMIVVTALLITFYVATPYRYIEYESNGVKTPFRINRFTGEVSYLNASNRGDRWLKFDQQNQ